MYQRQTHKIRHQTTAHLAQTMTLLNMSISELGDVIQSELSKNPALELSEDRRCPICNHVLNENLPCPICSKPKTTSRDEVVLFISPKRDLIPTRSDTVDNPEEIFSVDKEELPVYVLRQIASELEQNEHLIAAYLLNQLNKDGFLDIDLTEVALYFHVPISKIKNILKIIQKAEPLGVGSKNPKEALLIQLEVLSENKNIPKNTKEIIKNNFDLLVKKQYQDIAKLFQISQESVKETADFIARNLNPFPARAHWGNVRQPGSNNTHVYTYPDIIISYLNNNPNNPLLVEILFPSNGKLQINSFFKRAIRNADDEAKKELNNALDKATLFIKCLQQRNNTMVRLMDNLVRKQREFIKKGGKYLKPLTRAYISKELEVHESTISRAVANKSVQLPNRRIIPLSMFFERNLSVRKTIKEIIANEIEPLSDTKITAQLKNKGFIVARRTVSKYRAIESIPPAHMRKKLKER